MMRFPGRVTFRDFMERALYDPNEGFYGAGRVRFGGRGDFATASTSHPVLGEVVAAWATRVWEDSGGPDRFVVVEVGPGDGCLAAAIAEALAAYRTGPVWRLVLVERSPALVERQREAVALARVPVVWSSLAALAESPVDGVVVSIELVDALPVHRARMRSGQLEEQFVAPSGERLVDMWDAPSTPALREYLERYAPWVLDARESPEVEICLDATAFIASAAAALTRGAVLTLDYGDTADRLYTRDRPRGTIRAFYHGQLDANVLVDPGGRDITASVNFTALAESGRDAGLEPVSFESQREFLMRHDIVERIARRAAHAGGDERLGMKALVVPGGPGEGVRALVQRRSP